MFATAAASGKDEQEIVRSLGQPGSAVEDEPGAREAREALGRDWQAAREAHGTRDRQATRETQGSREWQAAREAHGTREWQAAREPGAAGGIPTERGEPVPVRKPAFTSLFGSRRENTGSKYRRRENEPAVPYQDTAWGKPGAGEPLQDDAWSKPGEGGPLQDDAWGNPGAADPLRENDRPWGDPGPAFGGGAVSGGGPAFTSLLDARAFRISFRSVTAFLALGFFNLVFVLGPVMGIAAVIFALLLVSLVSAFSPLWILLGSGVPSTNTALLLEVFAGLAMTGLGVLMSIGMYFMAKGFLRGLKKYIRMNFRLIGGE